MADRRFASAHDQHGHHDLGTHGMLLFGERVIYLSHLPMFDAPHNFQVLLRVGLSDGGEDLADRYRRDRVSSGERIYSLVPEEFHLSDLSPPESPKRTSFRGTIFRGHFERGGQPIIKGLIVEVTNVVYFQELDTEAAHDSGRPLTYLCFGEAGDLFAAHMITARPDFDQILSVSLPESEFAELEFVYATAVEFDRHDSPDSRLKDGEAASGAFAHAIGPHGEHGFYTQVRVGGEVYFESGELA